MNLIQEVLLIKMSLRNLLMNLLKEDKYIHKYNMEVQIDSKVVKTLKSQNLYLLWGIQIIISIAKRGRNYLLILNSKRAKSKLIINKKRKQRFSNCWKKMILGYWMKS